MNMKQVWGAAGGFFVAYLLITMTNKPQAAPTNPADPAPAAGASAAAPVAAGEFQKGFCFPGLGAGSLDAPETDTALDALAATGARWVAISPVLFQSSAIASSVQVDPAETPSVEAVAHAIDRARGLGLQVMLRPVVASHDGTAREAFAPLDPTAWLDSYTRQLDPYLAIAQSRGVAVVCLGSSYTGLEASAPWPTLIAHARSRYSGKLTYGAALTTPDGRSHVASVPFWSQLDYVGIDVVLPEAGVDAAAALGAAASELDGWVAANGGKPVILTSLGIPHGPDDAQRRGYRAFFEGLYRRSWLAGAYAYYWPNPAMGAPSSAYALEGQPALELVKASFAASR